MTEPLFFAPVFKERLWGGTHLTSFEYEIPSNQTGECWAFAAHQHGQSIVKNGKYKGLSLGELWEEHRELFGNMEGDRFPLLTKILDANQDLSVQVHPNDEYANVHENGELGKTECWYVIDSKEDAEIIYGHHAKTKEEFMTMIKQKEWNQLLHRVKVKPGDFFYVPSGTVHAIGKGILILETQQNSDTTYRLYDYDRKDSEGNLRELHLEKSIEVTETPCIQNQLSVKHEKIEDLSVTNFIECPYFSVQKWELDGSASLKQQKPFLLVSVIEGRGELIKEGEHFFFKKGDHFILPSYFGEYNLIGNTNCIVSSV
ncbi:TPA: mannose-6-phosphate isomerase, class I [Bacillus thuringiensis]|uniref:mannose-6-phosphate isomerase, class I n=1 Tax=Bacillus TaxID=1386 RepID=UPI0005CE6335|nr:MULTISPECIES: mannose-6-phosphate isomerase, class I [Bacillus]AJQ62422.1 mannose-6-phosphate isomerase [Bacillus thuringiensis serovar morrisoni]MED3098432.1 mannose-6-phosphate isomerase, class I [Bacillus thuringiensis]MRA99689.1 mannose-6-phosphate isomerase, class I [Bacillus thuringiensis]OTY29898.1 mannose-6-phosphate isomerase, class I [Bacillus thuringiensis serovar poloniensis]RNG62657.1 mannose-6-phosphate isomerase, class I [Bacillus thuringiensis]